jgi:hypothetical protein
MPPDEPALSGQLKKAFPYLVLHHEEFTWPRLLPDAPVSSYLTVSPIARLDLKSQI